MVSELPGSEQESSVDVADGSGSLINRIANLTLYHRNMANFNSKIGQDVQAKSGERSGNKNDSISFPLPQQQTPDNEDCLAQSDGAPCEASTAEATSPFAPGKPAPVPCKLVAAQPKVLPATVPFDCTQPVQRVSVSVRLPIKRTSYLTGKRRLLVRTSPMRRKRPHLASAGNSPIRTRS